MTIPSDITAQLFGAARELLMGTWPLWGSVLGISLGWYSIRLLIAMTAMSKKHAPTGSLRAAKK
jgi:hypothetical protein